MKREQVIELIKKYNPNDLREKEYKEQILDFIYENDNFAGRDNEKGHLTASSWILSKDRKKVLLTHHLKLNRWLQLGGHVEDDETILKASLREAEEESGLSSVKCISEDIFDIDVHLIPKRGNLEAHNHLDIRFLLEADENEELKLMKSESKDLKWVSLDEVSKYTSEESVMRMVRKTY